MEPLEARRLKAIFHCSERPGSSFHDNGPSVMRLPSRDTSRTEPVGSY